MSRLSSAGRLVLVGLAGALAIAPGCASTSPQPAAPVVSAEAPDEAGDAKRPRIPRSLQALDLSDAQRDQLFALYQRLQPRLAPLIGAGGDFMLAVGKAARRCSGDGFVLDDAASWAITAGDMAWDAMLDGIDGVHRILTPRQRRALSRRLLEQEEASRGDESTDKNARSIGDVLDLSLGQIFTVIARGSALKDALEERIEPWREKLKTALEAFPDADFAIRNHEISEAPVVALAARFMRDAVRTLLPVLDPEQCVALADFIEEQHAKRFRKPPSPEPADAAKP